MENKTYFVNAVIDLINAPAFKSIIIYHLVFTFQKRKMFSWWS